MARRIMNSTLCGLLAYFVLGLFLLGKGSLETATAPHLWHFRIFAMAGFLIIALGLLLLCLIGKNETDRSLHRMMRNPWSWGILGFLAVISYGAIAGASLFAGEVTTATAVDFLATDHWWLPLFTGFIFGASFSLLSAFIIVGQRKSTYSEALLAVTLFVLILCLATFLLTHLPAFVAPWINLAALIVFWIGSVWLSIFGQYNSHLEESTESSHVIEETDPTPSQSNPHGAEDASSVAAEATFTIRTNNHELPVMLISSLLGVFLFGVTSNSDGNAGPFDWGSNALFGMLTMSLVLLPIIYALRKYNLVPIFYWLVFPIVASILIIFDTFPEENPFAFAGSTAVYFFCTVVFLFSLALLVMLVQNFEGSPFLPVTLAEITLATASLCGVGLVGLFPIQNVRGPIVLILATIYFVYVLLSPILLFWQNRKSAQRTTLAKNNNPKLHPTEDSAPNYDTIIDAVASTYGLSKREHEILELVGRGYNSPYISAALVISENTTRTHLKNIYRKLGVSNRMDVVEMINEWQ